jgi:hypothetical protein
VVELGVEHLQLSGVFAHPLPDYSLHLASALVEHVISPLWVQRGSTTLWVFL